MLAITLSICGWHIMIAISVITIAIPIYFLFFKKQKRGWVDLILDPFFNPLMGFTVTIIANLIMWLVYFIVN